MELYISEDIVMRVKERPRSFPAAVGEIADIHIAGDPALSRIETMRMARNQLLARLGELPTQEAIGMVE